MTESLGMYLIGIHSSVCSQEFRHNIATILKFEVKIIQPLFGQ